ncbi:MAG: hypothetical protein EZS28_005462 [Streblomastix strix]|uniref:Uncharacterized protein n=1 Tax=Streblomastix strix TaxID=222440 RepID=A0A5J4WVJ8_9EUKA|nr:MAG: hypothetical protein EZS28_005462 [Streblomastix strix]
MRRYGMVDESYWEGQLNKKDKFYEQMTLMHKNQRSQRLIRRVQSQIPESPKSSISIKDAQQDKSLLAQQQQQSKFDLTQTQQKNAQPQPRSNPQLTPSLNAPVPLTPNALQQGLQQQSADRYKLTSTIRKNDEEAPTQEENKWKCELNGSYMILLATCPQLAVKERVEETIEMISECMYSIAKRLPLEAKQKITAKYSPIVPILFEIVKRYSTPSRLLTNTQNPRIQGYQYDDNEQQQDCGGANCDRAQIIVENILNCSRHLDLGEEWSIPFKTARHQAREAFPNSRLFKK